MDPTRLLQQQLFGAEGGAIASDSGRGGECMWAAVERLSRRVCQPARAAGAGLGSGGAC